MAAAYHRRVMRYPDGFDVEGPVQAEVFVVWLAGDHLELTGPCGPAPWLLELGANDHPVEVVSRIVRDVVGEPLLVHSTSWRHDRDAVILSFVVVIDDPVGSMASLPIARASLPAAKPRPPASDRDGQVVGMARTWPGWPRTIRRSPRAPGRLAHALRAGPRTVRNLG
jgi:hypothetical protein